MKVISTGEWLRSNQEVWDEQGRFQLVMQLDGNLVLYAYQIEPRVERQALWASHTDGSGTGLSLTIGSTTPGVGPFGRSDLLLYHPHGTVAAIIWKPLPSSPPVGHCQLHLQEDGNLVMYKSDTWQVQFASNTAPQVNNYIPPNATVLSIPDVPSPKSREVDNRTDVPVVVRTPSKSKTVPPNSKQHVPMPPGSLSIPVTTYDFSSGSNATVSRVIDSADQTIVVTKVGSSFMLS